MLEVTQDHEAIFQILKQNGFEIYDENGQNLFSIKNPRSRASRYLEDTFSYFEAELRGIIPSEIKK